MIAALIINRSGGLSPAPGVPGEAVQVREYMWEPGPDPEEPELTLEMVKRMFGKAKKVT